MVARHLPKDGADSILNTELFLDNYRLNDDEFKNKWKKAKKYIKTLVEITKDHTDLSPHEETAVEINRCLKDINDFLNSDNNAQDGFEKMVQLLNELIVLIWRNGEFKDPKKLRELNKAYIVHDNRHAKLVHKLIDLGAKVQLYLYQHNKKSKHIFDQIDKLTLPNMCSDLVMEYLISPEKTVNDNGIELNNLVACQLESGVCNEVNVPNWIEVRFNFIFSSKKSADIFRQQMQERAQLSYKNRWVIGIVELYEKQDTFCVRCIYSYRHSRFSWFMTHQDVPNNESSVLDQVLGEENRVRIKSMWSQAIDSLLTHFSLAILDQLRTFEKGEQSFDYFKQPGEGYTQLRWDVTQEGYVAVVHIPGAENKNQEALVKAEYNGDRYDEKTKAGFIKVFKFDGKKITKGSAKDFRVSKEGVKENKLVGVPISSNGPRATITVENDYYKKDSDGNYTPFRLRICDRNWAEYKKKLKTKDQLSRIERLNTRLEDLAQPGEVIRLESKDYPKPLDQKWPDTRNVEKYGVLHLDQNDDTLTDGLKSYFEDIPETKAQEIFLDLGAGRGNFVAELRQQCPNATIIAVGVTPLDEEKIVGFNQGSGKSVLAYTPIPDDTQILDLFEGCVDRVFDTFGALTYASDPLYSLIYAARLLKAGGKYSSVFSGHPGFPDASPLGDAQTRARIKDFFKNYFGVDLLIKHTRVNSEVTVGKVVNDWYISFEAPLDRDLKAGFKLPLDTIYEKADEEVGKHERIEMKAQTVKPVLGDSKGKEEEVFDDFKDFSIDMRRYVLPEKQQQLDLSGSEARQKI